ncbi:MAG: YicC/YloC family endoribonuclease [Pseudomonadota bacterium]
MPCSMTGFVRQEQQFDWSRIIIEIRSVNSRYLDVSMRLPDQLRIMEFDLKKLISNKLSRGKVSVNIQLNQTAIAAGLISYNKIYAKTIATTLHDIDKLIYNAAPVNAMDILSWPGVMDSNQNITDEEKADLVICFESAIANLQLTRQQEGDALILLILQRCEGCVEIIRQIKLKLDGITQQYREKLENKLLEYKQQLDPIRLEQEIVLFVQKMDIAEELDRIITHIDEVKRVLNTPDAQGRRLDFLMQELNREANTIGSKSVSVDTSKAAIDLKVLIEQMREQVQNIE